MRVVECSRCGFNNPSDYSYCGGCGQPLAVAVGLLCAIAATARLFYGRFGLSGSARTAYVVVLVPYTAASMAAVANNLLLALMWEALWPLPIV